MTLMEAGSDTTANTLMSFTIFMIMNQHIMHKGQEAVDSVVPASRLPNSDDISNIPYINQLVKEVMRMRPVIPLGVPHKNTSDDEVDGYYVPKNSIFFGNIWAMHHDPDRHQDPQEFRPERYEHSKHKSAFETGLAVDAMDRDHFAFGWGRRICPGLHLAEASVLLVTARMLWAYDILPAKDGEGKDIPVSADPEKAYSNNIFASPKPFPVAFRVRSEERAQVIRECYQDALATWEGMNLDLFHNTAY